MIFGSRLLWRRSTNWLICVQIKMMQTTTVLTPGGQLTGEVPVQNVVIIPSNDNGRVWTNYASKKSFKLGAIHIVVGVLCILFNIAAIAKHFIGTLLGPGIIGSICFILTGAFGIMAAIHKTSFTIITFMVLSILAAIFMLPLLVTTALSVSYSGYYKYTSRAGDIHNSHNPDEEVTMNSMMLFLSIVEVVVTIWSAVLACRTVCCGRRPQSNVMMQQVPMMDMGATQVIYTATPPATYPPTGTMGQQQAYLSPDSPSQPPLPTMDPPPQYEEASAPPPYEFSAPSASGELSTMPLFQGEEKKTFSR